MKLLALSDAPLAIGDFVSIKIRRLSLVAICFVLIGHVGTAMAMRAGDHRALIYSFINTLFSYWEVPFFFIVSGAMLRVSLAKHGAIKLVRKKFLSLFVPYLAWCLFAFVLHALPRGNDNLYRYAIGFGYGAPSSNPTLWYVHSLIVFCLLVVLAHAVCRLVRIKQQIAPIILFVGYMLLGKVFDFPFVGGAFAGFFAAGYVLAPVLLRPMEPVKKLWPLVAFLVGALSLKALLWFCLLTSYASGMRFVSNVMFIYALWVGYDRFANWSGWSLLDGHARRTFFVYCFHFPVMLRLRYLYGSCFGYSYLANEIGSVALAISCIFLSFLSANLVSRYLPRCYAVLTGGRI